MSLSRPSRVIADQIKESVIGMEVFDKTSSFDPRTDTIVRVEARRLRSKLSQYYEGEGLAVPVVIDLPKGSYVARVSRASR